MFASLPLSIVEFETIDISNAKDSVQNSLFDLVYYLLTLKVDGRCHPASKLHRSEAMGCLFYAVVK